MSQALSYAQPPRWHQRSRWRRRVFVALFIVAGGATWWFGPELWTGAQVIYRHHQCAAYTPSSQNQVVYEDDAAKTKPLLNESGYFNAAPLGGLPIAVFTPTCWADLTKLKPVAGRGAVVFLHERRAKNGVSRLVLVRFDDPTFTYLPSYVTLIEPAAPFGSSRAYTPALHVDLDWKTARNPATDAIAATRIFAGHADPNDASHFAIAYESGGFPGQIEGWLEDVDRVRLSIRSGPSDVTSFVSQKGTIDVDFNRRTIAGALRTDGDFRGIIAIDGSPDEPRHRLQPDSEVAEVNANVQTSKPQTQPVDEGPSLTPE